MNTIISDLALFADLGTEAPRESIGDNNAVIRMIRNGHEIELSIQADGKIVERAEGHEKIHFDDRALFASSNFGDLGRWADGQTILLKDRVSRETIPILGRLNDSFDADLEALDDSLEENENSNTSNVHILLIDGPAGIGKTGLIRALAFRRARTYKQQRRPLVLHVESRGRMLQNIMDLMAFSLQTLRVNVTYDQIPALVRRGLVTLVIDGFDELGDPSGYDLAWAQVNDLLVSIRGESKIVLAGRETFIGRERLIAALKSYREGVDKLNAYTIQPISPNTARNWLRERGWPDHLFGQENVEPIFEEGSYALRPFFLDELAQEGMAERISHGDIGDLTWFLVDAMTRREAAKFGRDVEANTTEDQRTLFVTQFLEEVARDLADNQTEAIASDSLSWIAEIVGNSTLPSSVMGIVKNRASVVAFLTDDDRKGYKRFSHAQLLNHFLARTTIHSLASNEIPKYIRRNILGADFLSSFSEVARNVSEDQISLFAKNCFVFVEQLSDQDRARRNLSALLLAITSVLPENYSGTLSDVSIDEALVTETTTRLTLKGVTIAQLDAREADLRAFLFGAGCHIVTFIADAGTAISDTFPIPQFIQLPNEVLKTPHEIGKWITDRRPNTARDQKQDVVPAELRDHSLLNLVGRVARYKSFWIRSREDASSRKILNDPNWDTLRQILESHDLLTTRSDVPASGARSAFYHIRRREDILEERVQDPTIAAFYAAVAQVAKENPDS